MTTSKATPWVLGTVAAGLLILAGAWFLLVSPVLDEAAATQEQTENVASTNDSTRLKLTRLKDDFDHLADFQAELAAVQAQVPTDASVDAYLEELDALAQRTGVTVTSVTPSEAEAFAPVVTAAAATTDATATDATATDATATDATATDAAATDAAATATAAPASAAPAGMVDIPVSVTVVGTYDAVLAFVDGLQQSTGRLTLVTSVTGSGLDDQPASGGRPATSVGDLEATIAGYVFSLPGTGAAAAGDAEATDPAAEVTLPGAVAGKNPLVPVG